MKSIFVVLSFFFSLGAAATNYYFAADGNDNAAGTSPSTPWQSINKFNSVFASKAPGDQFLFNRGDVFYGSLNISRSGTSGSPITIGAYGSGPNPVITGFTTVSSWTNLGSNIWESTSAVSTLSTCNMVAINGVNTAMGRWPNTGYNTITSATSTSITNSALNTNWTGARVVIRSLRWVMDTSKILSYSGSNTIHFTAHNYDPTPGWGYFIEDDARTLDQQNEWYYNPSTKKIRIYSTSSPTNVQISTVDTLEYSDNQSYITFSNLSFQGANKYAVKINNSNGEPYGSNFTFQNCGFDYSGLSAIDVYASTYLTVNGCTFNHSNGYAVNAGGAGSTHATITSNTVRNTGILPGMGSNSFKGIHSVGAHGNISNNYVDSTGFNPIEFDGDSAVVSDNLVTNFCFVLDDGAGIYTAPNQGTTTTKYINNNIVINGIGAGAGTDGPTANLAEGIYLDAATSYFQINNNSISSAADGLYFNNSRVVTARNNNIYDCGWGLNFQKYNSGIAMDSLTITKNIVVAKNSSQHVQQWWFYNGNTVTLSSTYFSDSNYFARPIDDSLTFYYGDTGGSNYTLAGWQSASGKDAHSHKSPVSISNTSQLVFLFNKTDSSILSSIPAGSWVDVKNVSYWSSTTLLPHTGLVLIQTSTITPKPVANAGGDGTLTLPTNTVYLSGSGSVSGGTITAYHWSTVSGPSSGTIATPDAAATNISDLIYGTYQFQLMVTDNHGATGVDTVQIRVVTKPVANAGGDGTLTLPTNTVYLSGSGSVSGGTITAYHWLTVSGPSSGTIATPDAAATNISDLIYGTYQFQLMVTDNHGATGVDTVQIRVVNAPLRYKYGQRISSKSIELSVYPNPFETFLKVSIADNVCGPYLLILTDAVGRDLFKKSGINVTKYFQETINTSKLQHGFYVLRYIRKGASSIIKILK